MPKRPDGKCKDGHDLDLAKMTKAGKRQCAECQRRRNREYARRKRINDLINQMAITT